MMEDKDKFVSASIFLACDTTMRRRFGADAAVLFLQEGQRAQIDQFIRLGIDADPC